MILEAGVVNLPEDAVRSVIHFIEEQTEYWPTGRLEEPPQSNDS